MAHYQKNRDLPGWFKLENYNGTEAFKAAEWLACIRIRKNIMDVLSTHKFEGLSLHDETMWELSDTYDLVPEMPEELSALRQAPLDLEACKSWASFAADYNRRSSEVPVREMLFSDLANQWAADRLQADSDGISCERWHELEQWPTISGEVKQSTLGAGRDDHVSLVVDMKASNAVLLDAFKAWLKEWRKQEHNRQRTPLYSRWARYRVLEYLDLWIWCVESGVIKSSEEMFEAVGYKKSFENFEKTVEPMIKALVKDLGHLEAVAAKEVSQVARNT
ncbi:hypothetical protein B9Q17_02305 [Marinobacter vinifirmus]|uniref:Uncharacterized protein n=1 Tax=Marinobacter vinifirmus TaxID=355591 RepID=A0A7Z1IMH0_9GAMM|nr:DUF6387 family protein [Marinobacter vinifirmus]OZC35697.1 hypothetical protein B9Q17_02305 [Marinobacter vinifirmus]